MTSDTAAHRIDATQLRPEDFAWGRHAAQHPVAAGVRRLVGAASSHDRTSPLDEAARLALQHDALAGAALWISGPGTAELTGFALVRGQGADGDGTSAGPLEVDLVVDPERRRAGSGRALADAVLAAYPSAELSAWSHGNHPGAAVLAERCGLQRQRDLWVMRRAMTGHGSELPDLPELPLPPHEPTGVAVDLRTFRPGHDEDALLEVNAAAFVHHPEQGRLTRADLDQRMGEDWFDPAGLFLAVDADGTVLGFHWTKVHPETQDAPAHGEVYVVGVSPTAQGIGLGRLLTLAGLRHLADSGLGEVILYVESDNAAAVATYQGLGFTHADEDTHVRYHRAAA
ncbi:MAG TPA: mycothiol synthase [Nocardioidaceae bacterium]|nr:mycothiol synthase [Nocardioidaceae bacterium]